MRTKRNTIAGRALPACLGLTALFWTGLVRAAATPEVFDHPVDLDNPPPGLTETARKMRERGIVRADFTQTRTLSALTRPLVSTGTLLLIPSRGLVWRVREPVEQTVVMSGGEMRSWTPGDSAEQSSLSAPRSAGELFGNVASLLSGNLEGIERLFAVFFRRAGDGGWTMGLEPERRSISRAIDRMVLRGTSEGLVTRFSMLEPSGDRVDIEFSHRTDAPPGPTEQELRYFEDR